MFRIKICGVTSVADAEHIAQSGADAIGLNFFRKSKRYVDRETARAIAACVPQAVQRVGVFVNESAEQVRSIANEVPLDWVQIHGDEPPAFLAELRGLQVIRALRIRNDSLDPITHYLQDCQKLQCVPQALLLDAYHDTQYGGTGCSLNWSQLYYGKPQMSGIRWVLAGGLRAENVQQAIEQAHPDAVDTASGVEAASGRKDRELVSAFVSNANTGFSRIDR